MIVDPDEFMVFQLSPTGDLNSRAGARNCKLGHIPSGYNHIYPIYQLELHLYCIWVDPIRIYCLMLILGTNLIMFWTFLPFESK